MPTYTILCLSDDPAACRIAAALRTNAYRLLVTGSATQAMAFLFINRRIDAVIIDQQAQAHANHGIARLLRSVRADVPILLVSPEVLQPLPHCVDACLSGEHILDALVPTLNLLLTVPAGDFASAVLAR